MAKPVIVFRSVKGSPLTYAELDTNFDNLQDATISLRGNTGGVVVASDLNDVITLTSESISIVGDNTAKTISLELGQHVNLGSQSSPFQANYKTGTVQELTTVAAGFVISQPVNMSVGTELVLVVTQNAAVAPSTISFTGITVATMASVAYHADRSTIEFLSGSGVAVIRILRTTSAYLATVHTDFV